MVTPLTLSAHVTLVADPSQALKTYHQYHTDCLAAEGKLKEATRLEEKQTGKSADLGLSQSGGQRRSSVKKIERLMEKVVMVV